MVMSWGHAGMTWGHAVLPGWAGLKKESYLVVVASLAIPDRDWIAVNSRTTKATYQDSV